MDMGGHRHHRRRRRKKKKHVVKRWLFKENVLLRKGSQKKEKGNKYATN